MANSSLIRFMYLFFFAIGFGSANCVAASYISRRLREFSATLGGLPPCSCALGFEVLTYQVLSDPEWLPGMAEDALFPETCAT